MAGGAGLTPRRRARTAARLALVAALVAGGHVLVLDWAAGVVVSPRVLRPMADPLFTRLLQPAAPPPAVAAVSEPKRPPARTPSGRTAIETIAPELSQPVATPTVATPEPAVPAASDDVAAAGTGAGTESPTATAPPAEAEAAVAASPPASAAGAGQPPTAPAVAGNGADPNAALDSWPRDTRVNYQLSGKYRSGDLYGGARVQWQRAGPLYQARVELDITLAGSRVLTSQGEVTPEGLRPDVFEEVWRGRPRSVRMGATTLTFNDGRTAPRPAGVQDSASQFVELSHRFATGRERLEVGRQVDVWLARPSAVDLWTYDIVDRELLRTPNLGDVEAFRLKPRPIANPRGNITAEIWFAPTLQHLPVRIRVSMGDEAFVDLIVDTIEQR